jgi:hypothetical protein
MHRSNKPSKPATKEEEDLLLQRSFMGIIPKMNIVWDLIWDDDAREKIEKSVKVTARHYGPELPMMTMPVKMFLDMQVSYASRSIAYVSVAYLA